MRRTAGCARQLPPKHCQPPRDHLFSWPKHGRKSNHANDLSEKIKNELGYCKGVNVLQCNILAKIITSVESASARHFSERFFPSSSGCSPPEAVAGLQFDIPPEASHTLLALRQNSRHGTSLFMLGSTFLKRYRAERFLGQGSMGAVYLARDQKNGGEVVVKVIHPKVVADPDFRQFFDNEIESLTQLRHPCVVGLLGAAYEDAHGPCLVMAYIPGISLVTRLNDAKFLPLDHVSTLLRPVSGALMAAHARRIVHRDLEPANLMVTGGDDPNQPLLKVMDFGLALVNAKPHIPLNKLRG